MYLYLMYSIQVHSDSLCFCVYCTPFRPWNSWEIVCWVPPGSTLGHRRWWNGFRLAATASATWRLFSAEDNLQPTKNGGKCTLQGKDHISHLGKRTIIDSKVTAGMGYVSSQEGTLSPKKRWQKKIVCQIFLEQMHDFLKSHGIFVGVPNLLGTSAMSFSCFCCVVDLMWSKLARDLTRAIFPKHGGFSKGNPLTSGKRLVKYLARSYC